MTLEEAEKVLQLAKELETAKDDAYWIALYQIKNIAIEVAKRTKGK